MSNFCPRILKYTLFFSFVLFSLFFTTTLPAFAVHKCGTDSICQPDHETCSNCPQDCGVCPAPTATPAPQPTSTPVPGEPTATPSQSSSSSSSSTSTSSTPSVTYYPSVALAIFSPNPTRQTSLTFSGTAAITQGTIQLVEYTITDGVSWLATQPQDGNFNGKDEHFAFTISNLKEGKYTIKVRAKSAAGVFTQEGSYASQTITIATTPPKVTLDKISPNPTKNQTPTISGKAISSLVDISKIEVSIDSKSWQTTKRSGNTFVLH